MAQIDQREVRKTYYPGGQIKTEGEYLDGKADGVLKEFYPSGKVWKEWNFASGKEEGISKIYFEKSLINSSLL